MKLFVITDLNRSLMRAKLLPLIHSDWVEEIVWLSRRHGPEWSKVRYVTSADSGSLVKRSWDMLLAAIRQVRSSRPDLVMAYNIVPFGLIACLISRWFRIPLALNIIGGSLEIEGGGYQIENRILSRLKGPSPKVERALVHVLKLADFVTTTGSRTRAYLIGKGLSADRVFSISSVIDPSYFRPEDRSPQYHLCCISSLIERKRLDWLIRLTAELKNQKKDIRVAILGEGPLRSTLLDLIKELDLEEHVDLLGFREDVREVLWRSRIFIMTSVMEGLPLSMIEAMACGLPPVVGDFGDVTDLVIDGKNGRIIPLSDYCMYKAGLLELLESEGLRQCYAEQALASVRANYTVQAARAKWSDVYRKLLMPQQMAEI
jgi:glycosyltransferase involved in cell wall biosynthesis